MPKPDPLKYTQINVVTTSRVHSDLRVARRLIDRAIHDAGMAADARVVSSGTRHMREPSNKALAHADRIDGLVARILSHA